MMRSLSVFVSVSLLFVLAMAQEIGLKVEGGGSASAEDTTISIKKGSNPTVNKKKYIISEGEEEITGDKDVLKKNADKNWKQACDDWKKEIKELNKDNKVISLSCGSMKCSKDGVESACKSTGSYKIRVLTEE